MQQCISIKGRCCRPQSAQHRLSGPMNPFSSLVRLERSPLQSLSYRLQQSSSTGKSSRSSSLHITAAGRVGDGASHGDLGRPARPAELQHGGHSRSSSSSSSSKSEEGEQSQSQTAFLVSIVALIVFGVANRVLYKLALVPLGDYVFFLAQFQTFGYCVVYFAALAARYWTGAVSKDQLKVAPWKLLMTIGAIEAFSQVLGFIGASKLPGVVLPLLQQSVMFFNLGFSKVVLKKTLAWQQILGATAVVAGVCIAALPKGGGAGIFSGVNPLYIGVFIASMAFPALDSITKEKVFKDSKEKLKGKDLDIFVVNSFASGFQALSVALMLPGIAALRGIGWQNLPAYLAEGSQAFMGMNGSEGAPLLPILYVTANLAFNICSLLVVRTSGALSNSLAIAALTPLTLWAFTFQLPYLGPAPSLGPNFLLGSAVLMAGLFTYNSTSLFPQLKERFGKSD